MFPSSLSGEVRLRSPAVPPVTRERIAVALRRETIEDVIVDRDTIRFRTEGKGVKLRPGGDKWLFGGLPSGEIIAPDDRPERLIYRLPMPLLLQLLALAGLWAIVLLLILRQPWPFFAALGCLWLSGGNYLQARIRFPRWLRGAVSSEDYRPRPLRPCGGGGDGGLDGGCGDGGGCD